MKRILFILIIILAGCRHKNIKGDRDIETPTSPGKKSGLTTKPESVGLARKQTISRKNYPNYYSKHKYADKEKK
jgi:hypothetical protein